MSAQAVSMLKKALTDLAKSIQITSEARQKMVITAITLRENGYVMDASVIPQFDRTRGAILLASRDLDNVLNDLKANEPKAWNAMIAAMNKELAKAPGVSLSSDSIEEIVSVAIPPFPRELLNPQDTPSVQATIRTEKANYAMNSGLGFLAIAATQIGTACGSAAGATAVTGIGPVIIGIVCALVIAAVVLGSIYFISKGVPKTIQSISPSAAASLAEAERLEKATDYLKAAGNANVPPDVLKQVASNLTAPPRADALPWAAIVALAGIGLYFWMKREEKKKQGMLFSDGYSYPDRRLRSV